MNAPTFTPGPWDYACDSYGKVRHSKKACVYQAGVGHIDTIAARIPNWGDAKLIAQTPELLWLAQRALAILHPNVPWTKAQTARSWEQWEKLARQIVHRATTTEPIDAVRPYESPLGEGRAK